MSRSIKPIALLLLMVATPGIAQVRYAENADSYGMYAGTGTSILRLAPSKESPAKLAQMFKDMCIVTSNDPDRVEAAVAASGWQAERYHLQIGPSDGGSAQQVRQWAGDGMVLTLVTRSAVKSKDAGLVISRPQCSIFVGYGLQAGSDLHSALTSAIGSDPVNAAEMTRNGKPNKRYKPRWQLTTPAGTMVEVVTLAIGPNAYDPNGVLMLSAATQTSTR